MAGEQAGAAGTPATAGWRFKLGVALFVISMIGPLLALPAIALLGLSAAMTATVSGLTLGGAEVLLIVAAAVMGKSGFAYLKQRAFGLLKRYGPPAQVGRVRYGIGLVMFVVPVAFGWAMPYAADLLPNLDANLLIYGIVGDALLLASLFVLGGDFWDKLRSLFVRDARAVFPEPALAGSQGAVSPIG